MRAKNIFARFHMMLGIIPTWPIVPTKDIPTVSFKEPWKRELARNNPNRYVVSVIHSVCWTQVIAPHVYTLFFSSGSNREQDIVNLY